MMRFELVLWCLFLVSTWKIIGFSIATNCTGDHIFGNIILGCDITIRDITHIFLIPYLCTVSASEGINWCQRLLLCHATSNGNKFVGLKFCMSLILYEPELMEIPLHEIVGDIKG